jgi:hypothetical protein
MKRERDYETETETENSDIYVCNTGKGQCNRRNVY